MDIDIELHVSPNSQDLLTAVRSLGVAGVTATPAKKSDELIIRSALSEQSAISPDEAVAAFLDQLKDLSSREGKRTLRVGVFYDLAETVVFPVRLSISTLAKLAAWSVELDVTGYPCSKTDEAVKPGSH